MGVEVIHAATIVVSRRPEAAVVKARRAAVEVPGNRRREGVHEVRRIA